MCREASLSSKATRQNATAGSPRSRSPASATGATGESSGHRFSVGLTAATSCLRIASLRTYRAAFREGEDALDAVVGLFGMLQVCLGQRASSEPDDKVIGESKAGFWDGRPSDAAPIPRSRRFAGYGLREESTSVPEIQERLE
jgi:hypothetical protein